MTVSCAHISVVRGKYAVVGAAALNAIPLHHFQTRLPYGIILLGLNPGGVIICLNGRPDFRSRCALAMKCDRHACIPSRSERVWP